MFPGDPMAMMAPPTASAAPQKKSVREVGVALGETYNNYLVSNKGRNNCSNLSSMKFAQVVAGMKDTLAEYAVPALFYTAVPLIAYIAVSRRYGNLKDALQHLLTLPYSD
jgi:hypothetical protein